MRLDANDTWFLGMGQIELYRQFDLALEPELPV